MATLLDVWSKQRRELSANASDQREENSQDLQTSNVFAAGMVDEHTASYGKEMRKH